MCKYIWCVYLTVTVFLFLFCRCMYTYNIHNVKITNFKKRINIFQFTLNLKIFTKKKKYNYKQVNKLELTLLLLLLFGSVRCTIYVVKSQIFWSSRSHMKIMSFPHWWWFWCLLREYACVWWMNDFWCFSFLYFGFWFKIIIFLQDTVRGCIHAVRWRDFLLDWWCGWCECWFFIIFGDYFFRDLF